MKAGIFNIKSNLNVGKHPPYYHNIPAFQPQRKMYLVPRKEGQIPP